MADFYIAHQRLDEARQILEPMATRRRTSGAAETRLARIDDLEGNPTAAEERLRRVLGASPNFAAALVLKAERSLRDGNLRDALWETNTAIAGDPRLVSAYYIRAEIELRTRRYVDAMRSYSEILRLTPDAVDAKVALSRLHVARNEVESGVLYAEEALKNAPDHLDARLALVRAWIARGDESLAESELARLTDAAAKSPEFHTLVAAVAMNRGDTAAARRSFERALQLAPASREALTALTTLDVTAKNVPGARKRLDTALRVEPDDPQLLVLAAKAALAAGDLTFAEALLRRSFDAETLSMEGFALLARVYRTQDRLSEITSEFDAVAQKRRRNVAARLMSAVAVHTAGNVVDAERRYQEILKIDPKSALAANNLASIYLERGENLDYAEQLAETALAQQPEAEIFDTLASIQSKRLMYGQAAKNFERAVALEPHNAAFQYRLGLAYLGMNDPTRARDALRKAAQLDPRLAAAVKAALSALPD
jgi:Flp pilus assembly protein TadD